MRFLRGWRAYAGDMMAKQNDPNKHLRRQLYLATFDDWDEETVQAVKALLKLLKRDKP